MELRWPKEIQFEKYNFRWFGNAKEGSVGRAGLQKRFVTANCKDKWGQFSFCLLLDKRCYFLVPILWAQCNNFPFATSDLFYNIKKSNFS